MMSRRGMAGDEVEDHFAVTDSAPCGNVVAEDGLFAIVVPLGAELEMAGLEADSPAGETAGDFLHVFLRVPAVHAQRVQLEDFAAEVLVESLLLADHHRQR